MASLLIVDDDPTQLRLRKLILEEDGHEIRTAETVADALSLLAEIEPDILIMDLQVPKLKDGLNLIREAHRQPTPPKIVVLSGWPSDLQGRPESKQVDRIFSKPVRSKILLRAISELLILLCILIVTTGIAPAETFRFSDRTSSEVVVEMDMSSPGSNWAEAGHEAALTDIVLDHQARQNVMLYAGRQRYGL